MKKIPRRKFIVQTGSALSFIPIASAFGKLPELLDTKGFDGLRGRHYITDNGADLYFYFINLESRGRDLKPVDPDHFCYIIFQIPPQSLHEQHFHTQPDGPTSTIPDGQLTAVLSGPSFLSFRLWPNVDLGKAANGRRKRLGFDLDALLDWENEEIFQLVTAADVDRSAEDENCLGDASRADWKYLNCQNEIKDVMLEGLGPDVQDRIHGFGYYQLITRTILKLTKPAGFFPITVFELPAGLLMVPLDPQRKDGASSNVVWKPIQNRARKGPGMDSVYEKKYELAWGKKKVIRTVTERWNVELQVRDPLPNEKYVEAKDLASIRSWPPALRAIGIVHRYSELQTDPAPCETDHGNCPRPTQPRSEPYLPTLLDQAELVYLNQLHAAKPYTGTDSDILIESPFLLTSMGASLKLHYNQRDTSKFDDPSLSLVEYEHHFQDGRDNYIKVARIGVIFPTGQKALHVQIAQRKIDGGASFLEYKEYLEIIEEQKDYVSKSGTMDKYLPLSFSGGDPDGRSAGTYGLELPFSGAKKVITRTPYIEPVLVPGSEQNEKHFWAYREMRAGEKLEHHADQLLKIPVLYGDRNAQHGPDILTEVPMLFLRRDVFCDRSLIDQLMNGGIDASLRKSGDERLRIPFKGKTIAYTKDDPEAVTVPDGDANANKINQLATDWVECYFDVREPGQDASKNVFDRPGHIIYPQMRRAKVFIDHLQQLGSTKLPSIIKYEKDYLEHELDPTNGKNPAKVILKHTEQFIEGKLTDLRDLPAKIEQDLENGWTNIQRTFKDAGERLGGLVNPDPALKRLSLTKSALSLPDLDLQNGALSALDPKKLFGQPGAELFCGISLKDILGMLDLETAPAYVLNKVSNLKGSIEAIGTDLNNTVLSKALAEVRSIKELINVLEEEVGALKNEVEVAVKDLRAKTEGAKAEMIQCQQWLELARLQLEADRLNIFRDITAVVDDHRIALVLELQRELAENGLDWQNETKLTELRRSTESWLDKEVRDQCTRLADDFAKYELGPKLKELGDGANHALTDLGRRFDKVIELIGLCFDDNGAIVEAELPGLIAAIELLKAGPDANDIIRVIFWVYDHHKAELEQLINTSIGDALKEAQRELEQWKQSLAYLEMVRRLSISYYRDRLQQVERDAGSLLASLSTNLPALHAAVNNLRTQGQAVFDSARQKWKAGNYAKAVQEITGQKQLLVAEFDALKRQLPTVILDQTGLSKIIEAKKSALREKQLELEAELKVQASGFLNQVESKLKAQLNEADLYTAREAWAKFEDLKRKLNAIRRQELSIDWSTNNFKEVGLGPIRFVPDADGATRLTMKAQSIVELDPLRYPSVITGASSTSLNVIENFGISFFGIIYVGFTRVSFEASTGLTPAENKPADVKVKIREVRLEGALSFIQSLQEKLKFDDPGFRMDLSPERALVGYETPPMGFSAPGFTFSNFSFGLGLAIHFDRTPMALTFALARPDRKATVAAGIYGGCFFCALTLNPKDGIVRIEMALEMGAYAGISFGPFRGEVKLMVGFYYKKDGQGVVLEGYIVAEGTLSVWIISVSARIYLSVRSQNHYVEGSCSVSYMVKVGILKKTFTATYRKKIAGASNGSQPATRGGGPAPALAPADPNAAKTFAFEGAQIKTEDAISLFGEFSDWTLLVIEPINTMGKAVAAEDEEERVVLKDLFEDTFQSMTRDEFDKFDEQHFG